ncbi:hypothetical protein ABW19_dt0209252 [Dactylella cylindrospora]|nr:hypothetical protein ABW19_dt0209252 [Dactylella cylindrospora]
MKLGSKVQKISRNHDQQQWILHFEGGEERSFDKVIISTGTNRIPNVPELEGLDNFQGKVIHSQAFKRPSDFQGKSVLVLGFSNTAADTATELVGRAKKIYLSHRGGAMPRHFQGKPIDHSLTTRLWVIQSVLNHYFPNFAEKMFNKFAGSIQSKSFKIRPEWNFSPAPSLRQAVPIISDNLVGALEAGQIQSVPSLRRVTGKDTVELTDGTSLTIDTIIFCTGYKTEYSILEPEYDPTTATTKAWHEAPGSNNKPLPRLYQNIFSLKAPQSLAFLGGVAFPTPAFVIYDLATMAIAQVWKGTSKLPSEIDMEKAVDEHHEWVVSLAKRGSVYPGIVKPGPWTHWVNDAAGTGVNEMLGYGLSGWSFWWRDRAFCNLLMDGLASPHMYRVFDGKRKKWDGVREAIEKVCRAK